MNIAIIGGGLTGLTAAYELLKRGARVTVFEKEKTLGGLAGGFKQPGWSWSLEKTYHHFFTSDNTIITLAKELGLEKDIIIKRPVTATLCRKSDSHSYARGEAGKIAQDDKRIAGPSNFFCELSAHSTEFDPYPLYQLDSPLNLLMFPLLSPIDKLRTAVLLGFCKVNPFWQPLERITAVELFKTIGGTAAWQILWEPLMKGKFGKYASDVPASWLWARVKKRTPSLGYFRGGFQTFVDTLEKAIKKQGGTIFTKIEVASINHDLRSKKYDVRIMQKNHSYVVNRTSSFDKILITTPSSIATQLLQNFSNQSHSHIRTDSLFVDGRAWTAYINKLTAIPHLFAQTLILETKEPILDKTYWLNVADPEFPFIAVVSHTNYMDKKYYGGRHITYIGNYLPDNHPYLKMTKQELLKKFLPYVRKINPTIPSHFVPRTSYLVNFPSAQPVHTLNYSKKAPVIQTPIEGIYLANLDSIYPWDRGTNYAVELGKNAATSILKS